MDRTKATTNFRKIRQKVKFSAAAQALYRELVDINGMTKWSPEFTATNQYLCHCLRISDKTLRRVRKSLIDSGLITFRPDEKRNEPGHYSLVENPSIQVQQDEPERDKMTVNVTVKSEDNIIDSNNILFKEKEILKKKKEEEDIEKQKALFEEFHQYYPGVKRNVETEYLNLREKHKDYPYVLKLLLPAIQMQVDYRLQQHRMGLFASEYANMRTWINNRRWEDEMPRVIYE